MNFDAFQKRCVNHHDFCDQMRECPYCELETPHRIESGRFGSLVDWSEIKALGVTAKDAAKIAGTTKSAAYRAAKRHGFKWPRRNR